jgi:hypothetical protein
VESTERPTTRLTLQRFAARPVLLVAAALFVLEMALSGVAPFLVLQLRIGP